MANLFRRVADLITPKPTHADKQLPESSAAVSPTPDPPPTRAAEPPLSPPTLPDLDGKLFDWLLDLPPGPDGPPTPAEMRLLDAFDAIVVADRGRGDLLPRAAGVIPHLIHSLRDDGMSAGELAQRVARDPHLVVEVTRLANSAGLRGHDPVTELSDAVRRLGTSGVRQAIARVVLKPMFDAQSGTLSGRATPPLWHHAQTQADLCRAMAVARGMDPFEAYLGGLLNNVGWLAGIRALDRACEGSAPSPANAGFSRGAKRAFRRRSDRLFVQFITAWQLNPALQAAAAAVSLAQGFDKANDPLAQLMLDAHRLTALKTLSDAGRVVIDAPALLAEWPAEVQAVYAES